MGTAGKSEFVSKWAMIAFLAAAVVGVFFAAANLYRPAKERQVDDCLSSGGCWDYVRGACEREDQCRCTPERCVRGHDGRLVLPEMVAKAIDAGAESLDGDARRPTCGDESAEKNVVEHGGWVQYLDDAGSRCIATPGAGGDGCSVAIATRDMRRLDGGAFAVRIGDGSSELRCGEEETICGRAFRCECQRCSETSDYATRMRQGRRVTSDRGSGGLLTVQVEYDHGTCTAYGFGGTSGGIDQMNRPFGACSVSFSDYSTVGGCDRKASGGEHVKCGTTHEVCDGARVRCECPDGGDRFVTLLP